MLEEPVKISLVIERADLEALDELAQASGVLFSDYVRRLLRRYIAARGTGVAIDN